MTTMTIAAKNCTTIMPALSGAADNFYMPTAVLPVAPVRRPTAREQRHAVSPDEVSDLIEASGPLSLSDIAGGLGVSVRDATPVAYMLLDTGRLRADEWNRFRLAV